MPSYINTEYFKYQLLDSRNVYLRDLYCVESANITYSSSSQLKQKATINITIDNAEDIDINNRIRIIHVLNDTETTVGTFLISVPHDTRTSYFKNVSLECHSTLWLLLADKTLTRHVVRKGTNVINEIKRMLDAYGYAYNLIDSIKTTSIDREWEIGTSYLTIINDLLETINYTPLYVNPLGNYIAKPYVSQEDRVVEFTYDETDENNILDENNENELNLFDVHNIFVKYVNDPTRQDLYAIYKNENPQSPTSIVNRPPNPHTEEVKDVSDVQTLMDMCKRDCSEETNRYNTCVITTSINPNHGYLNCLYVNLNEVSGKFIEDSWDMECETGGNMKHHLRRMVIV